MKSPNKSTTVHDLIQNSSQTNAARVDYYPVSHRDSEIDAEQNGNLERHEVQRSKIVFNAKYASNVKDQAKHFVLVAACDKALPRRSRSMQSKRTSSGFIMYVPCIHDLAWKNTQRCQRYGKSAESQKTQKSKRLLRSCEEAQVRNDRGALPRGRAISNAHARTRIHAVRHGRFWTE